MRVRVRPCSSQVRYIHTTPSPSAEMVAGSGAKHSGHRAIVLSISVSSMASYLSIYCLGSWFSLGGVVTLKPMKSIQSITRCGTNSPWAG